jgi:hypothetical protein
VVSALVLLGAVGFTLVAAYQWAGRLGIFVSAKRGGGGSANTPSFDNLICGGKQGWRDS